MYVFFTKRKPTSLFVASTKTMFNEIHVYLKSIIDMSELVQQGGQSVVPVRGVLLQSVH